MRLPLVAGNWKMNGSLASIKTLVEGIKAGLATVTTAELAICPPYVYIPQVAALLKGTSVALGAQDVNDRESGAHTGEVHRHADRCRLQVRHRRAFRAAQHLRRKRRVHSAQVRRRAQGRAGADPLRGRAAGGTGAGHHRAGRRGGHWSPSSPSRASMR